MKSFWMPGSGQAWGMDRAREWRWPLAVFETRRPSPLASSPWADVVMPHRRLHSYHQSKKAARSTNIFSYTPQPTLRRSFFGHIAKTHPHCPQSAMPWLVPPSLHHGVDTLRYSARSGGIASISSFEGATCLMKCPRRRAELDTKHKSQRYDEIGQCHAWGLARSTSLTSLP